MHSIYQDVPRADGTDNTWNPNSPEVLAYGLDLLRANRASAAWSPPRASAGMNFEPTVLRMLQYGF